MALTALVLLAVLSTAAVVHASWSITASRNVETVVASLNAQTAAAVRRELDSAFHGAEGGVEIIRSILFQDAVKADDEVKREFVFLSVLRALPAVSWIGFGFPDGRFFGSHATKDGRIEMVEISGILEGGGRRLRRDRYRPIPGDIFFESRSMGESLYVAFGSPWFRAAKAATEPVWSMVEVLPNGFEPAAVVSARLDQHGRFRGVLMVSLNLGRLSKFLSRLDAAQMGLAVIVSGQGTVIASSKLRLDDGPLEQAIRHSMTGEVATAAGPVHVTATALDFNGWRLFTAIPRSAFTAEIDRNTRRLLAFVAVLALLGAGSAAVLANRFFARPIQRMAGELRHVETFSLDQVKHMATWLTELDELSRALQRMARSLSAFGSYVPTEIVRTLIDQGVEAKPGSEAREITVLFADLPEFTKMTEHHGADLVPFLTEFLTIATEAVHREGGTVDKFIGDCIMAFWNAPTRVCDHPMRACRAAQSIRHAMRRLSRPDGRSEAPFVRIGINTGVALVGNVGSAERLSYTAIGDVVNVASRLEALAKELDEEALISEATWCHIASHIRTRALGSKNIRGREAPIAVHALLDSGNQEMEPRLY